MQVSRKKSWLRIAAVMLLASAGVVSAQGLPSSQLPNAAPPAPVTPNPEVAPMQVPTIVATSNLVNMVFTVVDKHGAIVPNLTRADFRVLDNGQPQTIQFFSAEQELPLT